MPTREAVDLYAGHPGFDQRPTPRPVTDDDVCGRCRHPRWMHNGQGHGACQMKNWALAGGRDRPSCRCVNFIEADL